LFRDFIRSDETDLRNKMLNYRYAVVRACLARALVANGLLPCFGIHHDSDANSFNLADDLFEPFRPLVDRKVFEMTGGGVEPHADLTVDHRRTLAAILNADTKLTGETVSVLIATERASESLVRAMESSSPAVLCLPRL
jgi:CRISPR-associated protein Cas1